MHGKVILSNESNERKRKRKESSLFQAVIQLDCQEFSRLGQEGNKICDETMEVSTVALGLGLKQLHSSQSVIVVVCTYPLTDAWMGLKLQQLQLCKNLHKQGRQTRVCKFFGLKMWNERGPTDQANGHPSRRERQNFKDTHASLN